MGFTRTSDDSVPRLFTKAGCWCDRSVQGRDLAKRMVAVQARRASAQQARNGSPDEEKRARR